MVTRAEHIYAKKWHPVVEGLIESCVLKWHVSESVRWKYERTFTQLVRSIKLDRRGGLEFDMHSRMALTVELFPKDKIILHVN